MCVAPTWRCPGAAFAETVLDIVSPASPRSALTEVKGHIAWTGSISCYCTNNLYLRRFLLSPPVSVEVSGFLFRVSPFAPDLHPVPLQEAILLFTGPILLKCSNIYSERKSRSKTKHPPLPTVHDPDTALYRAVPFPHSQVLWTRCSRLFCKHLSGTVGYSLVPDFRRLALRLAWTQRCSITREPTLCHF